jgi:hypothetical protein
MPEYKDLETMLEIVSLAIVRQETEEHFFRRSANSSTNELARSLFTEIADDMADYRKSLEVRRDKLVTALNDLKKAKGKSHGEK